MIKEITPQDALVLFQNGTPLVDVRELNELQELSYEVPNVIHIPLSLFEENYYQLPVDQELIIACRSGGRSYRAAQYLMSKGYSKVSNLTGGILEWHAQGLPTSSSSVKKSCTSGGGCC